SPVARTRLRGDPIGNIVAVPVLSGDQDAEHLGVPGVFADSAVSSILLVRQAVLDEQARVRLRALPRASEAGIVGGDSERDDGLIGLGSVVEVTAAVPPPDIAQVMAPLVDRQAVDGEESLR